MISLRGIFSSRIFLASAIIALTVGGFIVHRLKVQEIASDVLPVEDLMREHGALNRLLLIYDAIADKLDIGVPMPKEPIYDCANLIKTFIEEYHEKLEEEHIFPLFKAHDSLNDLVLILKTQHEAGRILTRYIMEHAHDGQGSYDAQRKLANTMKLFIRMYRPHEAQEDTQLFPAIRSMMSAQEYLAMGDKFESREIELFGENGFQSIIVSITRIERQLGINKLAQFTPDVQSMA